MSIHFDSAFFKDFSDEELYKKIVESTFEATIVHRNFKVLYANEKAAEMLGAPPSALVGAPVLEVFTNKELIKERIRAAQEENRTGELIEQTIKTLGGSFKEVELYCQPFDMGEKRVILSVWRDITARKNREQALRKKVNEVSTPIVPVSDGISVIPLVGTIDYDKAQLLLETLPQKLKQETDIDHIIIDFSGIYNLDKVVIDFLLKINSVMRLLGVVPILTGIRPELAQKAMELGENLSCTITKATVKDALRYLKQL